MPIKPPFFVNLHLQMNKWLSLARPVIRPRSGRYSCRVEISTPVTYGCCAMPRHHVHFRFKVWTHHVGFTDSAKIRTRIVPPIFPNLSSCWSCPVWKSTSKADGDFDTGQDQHAYRVRTMIHGLYCEPVFEPQPYSSCFACPFGPWKSILRSGTLLLMPRELLGR
jgi:hypothetical protein